MYNLWLPEGIYSKIDSCIRQFIWGGKSNHWVKLNTITQPSTTCGLIVRRGRHVNVSMLGKHVWELLHRPGKLWV